MSYLCPRCNSPLDTGGNCPSCVYPGIQTLSFGGSLGGPSDKEIEFAALLAEKAGMLAENEARARLGHSPAYGDTHFYELAEKMRALKSQKEPS